MGHGSGGRAILCPVSSDPAPMSRLRPSMAVSPQCAERYRAEGWWDERRLADGIEAAARARPDGVAVVDNAGSVTYAQLAGRVASAMGTVDAWGVRTGDPAVVVAGNTIDGVVAYHALLRVGATAALLDRRCGPADLHGALDALGLATAVVIPAAARERLLDAVPDRPDLKVMSLESMAEGPSTAPFPAIGGMKEPDRDAPAVVLFTSGTTSRPKGVLHSLNTITAGAQNLVRITGADERSVFFLASPLASITGVTQMHLVADQHATLVLEDRFDPERSLDRINEHGATLLGGAPVLAERLLRAADGRHERQIALRLIALGGAMLPMPVLELAMDCFGIDVARVYGSSEAPNSTGSLPHEDRARRLADDGALMPGTEVRIGSAGHAQEGLLRGPAVFLGYVDPAHNALAFDDGWFRTGDAVEVHNGRLTVVGRLKELVNRNGLKISLSEIDAALERLSGVVEYASFGVPDQDTGERLVVAVRAEDAAVVTLEGICTHLRSVGIATRKLPEQLVVWDEALPRTASGKIVRSRLAMESSGKPAQYAPRLR
jgi:acyl-CoA synthetase (AMP-forming)/AMP-acid ligase II